MKEYLLVISTDYVHQNLPITRCRYACHLDAVKLVRHIAESDIEDYEFYDLLVAGKCYARSHRERDDICAKFNSLKKELELSVNIDYEATDGTSHLLFGARSYDMFFDETIYEKYPEVPFMVKEIIDLRSNKDEEE